MKVQIVHPYSADNEIGQTEQHYGVTFTIAENEINRSVLVADLTDDEAEAMIKAGRVEAVAGGPDQGPTRDDMKAYLKEKGVDFPGNIKTDKLAELYESEKGKE